jgi:acyl-CoA thioesterase
VTIEELLGIDGDVVRPPAGWSNGWGSTFGGYVAGVLMYALDREVPEGQSMTTAQLGFVEPLRMEPEGRLSVEVHRIGRSASSLSGRVEQDGATTSVALGWSSVAIEQPSRIDVTQYHVGPPTDYEPRRLTSSEGVEPGANEQDRLHFVERDFDTRPVPTPEDGTLHLQWMRLKRLELGEDEPWPAAAIGLVADMVGAGQFRAAQLELGEPHALLSLDLTIHLAAVPHGPWLLGVFHNVALANGRAIGRGELYDQSGTFAAGVTQLSLVRPFS